MTLTRFGRAGLQGWRGRLADRAAPPIARRFDLDEAKVRGAIGLLFLAIAAYYAARSIREAMRQT